MDDSPIKKLPHTQRIAIERAFKKPGTVSLDEIKAVVGYAGGIEVFSKIFQGSTGKTFLHFLVEQNGSLEVLEYLLQQGVIVDIKDPQAFEKSPVVLAKELGRTEMVALFKKHGTPSSSAVGLDEPKTEPRTEPDTEPRTEPEELKKAPWGPFIRNSIILSITLAGL